MAGERLSDAELSELERLEREATPRPWTGFSTGVLRRSRWVVSNVPSGEKDAIMSGEDAELIATARNALPRLLAEVRELRARLGSSGQIPRSQQHLIRAEAAHGRVREALASLAESIRQAQIAITDEENP